MSNVHYSLLVFEETEDGPRTVGEYSFKVPYASSQDTVLEPLRKLKPQFTGVLLGHFGVMAHSAEVPESHPWYRSGAIHVTRQPEILHGLAQFEDAAKNGR